jgi:hypothetical protein
VEGIEIYSEDTPGHTLGDLLQRQNIKAVIIVLPIPVQPDIIRRCFAARKHVLSEKPIAKDVSTARLLLEDYKKEYASNNIISTSQSSSDIWKGSNWHENGLSMRRPLANLTIST